MTKSRTNQYPQHRLFTTATVVFISVISKRHLFKQPFPSLEMCSIEHHCTEVISLFRWPIHNFARKTILDDPMAYLESEDFTLFQSRLTFFLQFWPTDGKDSIYSNLLLLPRYLDNYSSVQLQFKFYLENAKGDRVNGRHC